MWTRTAIIALSLAALTGPGGDAQSEPRRITAASNVRLRAGASEEVPILASLPIATDLIDLDRTPDGRWVHVRTPDGTDGWVFAALTRAVPEGPGQRARVVQNLIVSRLGRAGDGFQTRVELLDLIERTGEGIEPGEAAARSALNRLRALDGVARSIGHGYRQPSEAVSSWLAARTALVVYNEPGGLWMLRRDAIVAEYERHRGTRAAEGIAWLAATNGVPGECEGDVPCYAERTGRLEGWYLREYAQGAHVHSALTRLLDQVLSWQGLVVAQKPRLLKPESDCGRLKAPLASIRQAVEGTAVVSRRPGWNDEPLRAALLRAIDDLAEGCRSGLPAQ